MLLTGFFSSSIKVANVFEVVVSAVMTILLEPKDYGVAGVTSLELENFPICIIMMVCLVCCTDHTTVIT